jgi:hypothetical protein
MKDYITLITVFIGSFIIGISIIISSQVDRYQYLEKDIVFDKKSGTIYYTDLKQYVDIKGDKYQFE